MRKPAQTDAIQLKLAQMNANWRKPGLRVTGKYLKCANHFKLEIMSHLTSCVLFLFQQHKFGLRILGTYNAQTTLSVKYWAFFDDIE